MNKLLLIVVLFLTSTSMFSQLYISPIGTKDSYIYVDSTFIFVEKGIDLTLNNNDPTLEGSIYLRNESQLLQGISNTPNSGTGYISVYQETPDDDAWDYSVWNSPVGNYITSSGNEKFGVMRIYDSLSVTNSAPSQFTTLREGIQTPMTISTRWTYMFVTPGLEAEASYTRINANNMVPPAFGFLMKGLGPINHKQRYDFRGRPKNGDLTIPVENNKMTLSGNPYPSALDLKLLFSDNPSLGSMWYYDEDRTLNSHYYSEVRSGFGTWVPGAPDPYDPDGIYVVPVFQKWNAAGNSSGSYGSGSMYKRRYAPIGQGIYFVGNTTGTVTMKNSQRVYVKEGDVNGSIYRRPGSDSTDMRSPQIRIYTTFGESHSREMILAFSEFATDGYDRGMDGKHPQALNSDAYFPIDGDKYVIQFIDTDTYDDDTHRTPIAFNLDKMYEITVKVSDKVHIMKNVYILDRLSGTTYQIDNDNKFVITLPSGIYEDRFYIVFMPSISGDGDGDGGNNNSNKESDLLDNNISLFQNNIINQLEIYNKKNNNIEQVSIHDVSGKLIVNKHNLGNNSQININTSNMSVGVYIIQVITTNNYIKIDKIIIQ